jgi:sulfur carrier protein ThiS
MMTNDRTNIELRVITLLRNTRMTTRELAAAMNMKPVAMSQWLTRSLRANIIIRAGSVRIAGSGVHRVVPLYTVSPDYIVPPQQDDTKMKRVNLGPGHTRVIFGDRWRPGPDRMQSSPVNGLVSSFEKI